jgi:hypothetical protein
MGMDSETLLVKKLKLGLELLSEMQRVDPMTGFDTDFDIDVDLTAGSEAVKVVAAAAVAF